MKPNPLFIAALPLWLATAAVAAPPTLSHVFPAGGQRGTTVTVTCSGKFDWPLQVDAPGVEVALGEESGQLDVTIPEDLAADRVWFRLYNAGGASAAVPFLVGNLLEINETEPNDAPSQAESLDAPGLVVNGVLKGADTDAFSVPVEAGQTLVAAIDANTRLGSPIDTVLQVTLPNGIVLADNHDDLGLDPRVTYTPQQSGRYLVRLFGFSSTPNTRIALQGGDDCVYRLTITTGAYVTHAVPLSVPVDEPGQVELFGWNLPSPADADVTAYGHPQPAGRMEQQPHTDLRVPGDSRLGFANRPDASAGARVRLVPFATSAAIDRDPDDAPLPIELPHAVTGRLQTAGQADAYQVTLSKGDPLLVTVEARTLGLLPDPLVRLVDPDGKQVAEVDDSAGTRDATLAHTAAADGPYLIIVTDRHRHGGPRAFYQLTARLDEPDFELTTAEAAVVLPADEPVEVVVNVTRRGAAGPITVSAAELPEGITAEPVVSETKGDTAKQVKLKLTGGGSPFSGPIRIVGEMSEPRPVKRDAQVPAEHDGTHSSLWLTALAKADAAEGN